MLRSLTTLVVGAGASCEAKFPDGRGLLDDIEDRLRINFDDFNNMTHGDPLISNSILNRVGKFGQEFNNYLRAAWRIRDAAPLCRSIDNIIEQHDDDNRVAYVGKLAIVSAILSAERASLLMPREDRPFEIDHRNLANTWYNKFAQILMDGVSRRNAADIFRNLRIVCFNYDRSIEQYFPLSLSAAWGIPLDESRQLVHERLQIVHPYGTIAPLGSSGARGIAFGGPEVRVINNLWENIRTFGERQSEAHELDRIRSFMAEATQVIFLGFAFHQQNMDLLGCDGPAARRALATVMGLAPNEKRQIELQLRQRTFKLRDGLDGLVLHDGSCSSLFADNWRTITS